MPSISPVKETNGPDTIRTVSPNLKVWGLFLLGFPWSSSSIVSLSVPATLQLNSHPTLAFSCGARSAIKLKEKDYLRSMLSRRQLQGFVMLALHL
jgi:hypothetical protein